MTAEQINLGLLAIWRSAECQAGVVQPLIQVHDSILLQYKEDREEWVLPRLKKLMHAAPLTLPGNREFNVPCEIKIGWNWADADKENPQGLVKFDGRTHDTRHRQDAPQMSRLDRLLSRSF